MELNETIKTLVESTKYTDLSESDASFMGMMLNNAHIEAEKALTEGTVASDIAQFTPIIMPLVRRVYPNLIANELLGVQPMALPTGFIYALTNKYLGNSVDGNNVSPKAIVVLADGKVAPAVGADLTQADGIAVVGKVVYVEGQKVLVECAYTEENGNTITVDAKIVAKYTNEMAFAQIFADYSGPMATAEAEVIGEKMNEVGFDISRKAIEAKSRNLKGRYSVEMYQDLKAQHGLAADEELMSLISYETQAELDREIVSFVNTNSTQVADALKPGVSDGRWELEKYRTEVIKMKKESTQIGLATKRGQANIAVVSPNVVTMMEEVGSFKTATKANGAAQPIAGGVAGTFDNKFKVVVDQHATSDYATLLYKGADRRDSMGFFAPYVPLSFTKVTNFETGQPAIIAKTRYALETIPGVETPISNDRAKAYGRSFGVDFTGTALA